jgi:hypothetical protein
MATVSTPVAAWVAQLQALSAGGVNQSASLTVTVHLTQAWEIQIPIQYSHQANISADPIVFVFSSGDGGTTYDSNPFTAFSIARTPGAAGGRIQTIRLSQGNYCIQLLNSGPNSAFFGVLTQMVVTSVLNV